jgi:hypothetical protein
MTSFNLPLRALHDIRLFSRPLSRPDWRTCKQEESDLIWNFICCINDQNDQNHLYDDPEWTLYGKIWYLSTDVHLVAFRQPRAPPPPFEIYDREYKKFEYPCQLYRFQTEFSRIHRWYQYRIQWING